MINIIVAMLVIGIFIKTIIHQKWLVDRTKIFELSSHNYVRAEDWSRNREEL